MGSGQDMPAGMQGKRSSKDALGGGDDQSAPSVPEGMRAGATASLPAKTLQRGDRGADVASLVDYLTRFGYFPNNELRKGNLLFRPVVAFKPQDTSVFDDRLEKAVTKFQQQHSLRVTGSFDDETLELMKQPRCGFPDQPVVGAAGVAEFVAQGNRWPNNNITYRVENTSPDLGQAEQRAAVRAAFDRWTAVTPLGFTETTSGGDMLISWQSGDHGDGFPFDGPGTAAGNVLAHCFYPPPNGGDIAGDCHFDEAETWSVDTPPSGVDLLTIALHELGHGLGLAHSAEPSSVMYAYYGGPRRELTDDDIQGIQSIYGARFRWGSLGGSIFEPVVGRNQDGRLEVFVRGTDQALWHIWQTAPNNGWSGWESLGGVIQGQMALGQNEDGRLELFVRGSDGALWHIWQTAPNNGWSGWESLGGFIWDPVVTRNADGRLEVFVRGGDGALWHIWQTAPSNGWSGWESLGGVILGAPTAGRNADGRLEVFATGTDNGLWQIWQTARNNGWSGWATLGGVMASTVSVGNNADGRLEVFVRGTDGALWHIWQTAPNNGWSVWATLGGGIQGSPVAGSNADGRLEVFVKGLDNGLWNTWQSAPNNGWT